MVTARARSAWVLAVASGLMVGVSLPVSTAHAAGLPPDCTGAVSAGDDTITCTGDLPSGSAIDTGAGDDTIVINADVLEGAVVTAGPGNDKITAYNVGRFVCPAVLPDSEDEIGADDVNGGVLDGGAGNDEITVGGQARPAACDKAIPSDIPDGNVGRHGAVRGGDGADTLTVGSIGHAFQPDPEDLSTLSRAHGGQVAGDAGDDKITIGSASLGERPPSDQNPTAPDAVFGGAGHDTISLTKIIGAADVFGDAYQPIEDAGNDTITVGPMTGGWVRGGPGDDTLTATQMSTLAWLFGDTGNDAIKATDLLGFSAWVFGGDGDDALSADTVGTVGSSAYVMGGNGHDTIDVGLIGEQYDAFIRGDGLQGDTDPNHGTGKDAITVGTNKGDIFAGNDDDTITIELNEKLADGGAGSDTCTITTQGTNATAQNCEQNN